MPARRKFDEQIAALDALRQVPDHDRVEQLHKALGNRNNFLVAKAADLAREFGLTQLTPDILSAFNRFFANPEKTDPQCWAKNALSRALASFGHQDAEVFLRGMRHIQLEPVWGGRSDTAGTLRSTCALALVQCRGLSDTDLLAHLIDLFGDQDKAVRAELLRATAQLGSPSAALVLRTKAILAKEEPEVLGVCYEGILAIEGVPAIPWISQFLAPVDETAAEAAIAIAATHSAQAFECLKQNLENASDSWWRSVLLSAIALTRQDAAMKFLLDMVETESLDATTAIDAIMRARPSSELLKRLETLTVQNHRLAQHLATARRSS
jgi:hypothetical protein